MSLKFVPKGPINNIPSLVQIMVWHRPEAKPLSEPMIVSLLTHIHITRPQWVNYTLFAGADTRIYTYAASQNHVRPKAKRGIAMLGMDKFPLPQKQTRGNEFIPCSKDVCHILKCFRIFKAQLSLYSALKHSINTVSLGRIAAAKKWATFGIATVTSLRHSFLFYISGRWRQTWDTLLYFTNVSQSEARVSTEHWIKYGITTSHLHYGMTIPVKTFLYCRNGPMYPGEW